MYKNREILASKYKELGSLNKTAEYFGVSKKLILNYMKRYDIPRNKANKDKPKKEKVKSNFHKGYIITESGYRKVRAPLNHPKKDSKGYIQEHVLVMEAFLGRYLEENEVVHHKDRNKLNNSLSNLELMDRMEHRKMHSKEPRKKIDLEHVINLFEKGYTYQQVCDYFNISQTGLRKRLKREGIQLNLERGGARRKVLKDLQ